MPRGLKEVQVGLDSSSSSFLLHVWANRSGWLVPPDADVLEFASGVADPFQATRATECHVNGRSSGDEDDKLHDVDMT